MPLFDKSETQCRKELYNLFCNTIPRKELLRDLSCLTDVEYSELQDWVGCHMNCCIWSTSIGLMEAIDHMIDCAKENNNIK